MQKRSILRTVLRLLAALALMGSLGLVLSACTTTAPAPEVITLIETVVAEKVVEVAVEVEAAPPAEEAFIVLPNVQDEVGNPIAGAEVYIYHEEELVARSLTDSEGEVELYEILGSEILPGDRILAMALQHEEPSAKGFHDGWAYRIYTTNYQVQPDGSVLADTIAGANAQTIIVRKTNPLVLFNVVVSLEWAADETYLNQLEQAFRLASAYLYDVTDGQFAFGQVTIYDGGQAWEQADFQVLVSNQVRPRAPVWGIKFPEPLARQIKLGRFWSGQGGFQGRWDEPDGYRTLIHEWAHYAFGLYEEYLSLDGNGQIRPGHCTGPDILTNSADATNASIMDWHYKATEFWEDGLDPDADAFCQQTLQWQNYQKSDWDMLVDLYQNQGWDFTTPADLFTAYGLKVNPGPEAALFHFPDILVPPSLKTQTIPLTVQKAPGLTPGAHTNVYLFVKEGDQFTQALDLGYTNANSNIEIPGVILNQPDKQYEVKGVIWPGAMFGAQLLTPGVNTLVMQPSGILWVEAAISEPPQGTGLELEVQITLQQPVTDLKVDLFEIGGAFIGTWDAFAGPDGSYVATVSLGEVREGHLYLRALGADDGTVETVTSFIVGGTGPSETDGHPAMASNNHDGSVELHLPGGIADGELVMMVMMMEVRGVMSPLPPGLRLVRGPYMIGSWDDLPRPASLTLHYFEDALAQVDEGSLRIYQFSWNTSEWTDLGGQVDPGRNAVTTVIEEFGIYAILGEAK